MRVVVRREVSKVVVKRTGVEKRGGEEGRRGEKRREEERIGKKWR
jgi:hypothetical protein